MDRTKKSFWENRPSLLLIIIKMCSHWFRVENLFIFEIMNSIYSEYFHNGKNKGAINSHKSLEKRGNNFKKICSSIYIKCAFKLPCALWSCYIKITHTFPKISREFLIFLCKFSTMKKFLIKKFKSQIHFVLWDME